MQIELKKIRVNERASQETFAFSADIYVDGRRAGLVFNEGRGGANHVNFTLPGLALSVREFIRNQPPLVLDSGTSVPMTEDAFLSVLIDQHQQKKSDEKMQKKALAFAAKMPPRYRVFLARVKDEQGLADLILPAESEELARLKATSEPEWTLISIREVESKAQRMLRLLAKRSLCTPALLVELDAALHEGVITGPAQEVAAP